MQHKKNKPFDEWTNQPVVKSGFEFECVLIFINDVRADDARSCFVMCEVEFDNSDSIPRVPFTARSFIHRAGNARNVRISAAFFIVRSTS